MGGHVSCSQVLLVPAVLLPHAALLHLLRHDGGGRLSARAAGRGHLLRLLLPLVPLRRIPHPPPGARLHLRQCHVPIAGLLKRERGLLLVSVGSTIEIGLQPLSHVVQCKEGRYW